MISTKKICLIILDIKRDLNEGFKIIRELKKDRCFYDIPVIILATKAARKSRIEAFKVGAMDYVTKPFVLEELKCKIDYHVYQYHNILKLVKSQVNSLLMEDDTGDVRIEKFSSTFLKKCRYYKLSEKEIQIIKCILQKLEHKQISHEIGISINTVNYHLKNIYSKVGVKNRSELIIKLTVDEQIF